MSESAVIESLQGKRVVVLGMGVNHAALVPWLVEHGVSLVVRDKNPDVREKYSGLRVEWDIRENILEALDTFDVIFRTPAIPFHAVELQKALARGAQVTSQTKLFFQLCPCEIVGVTGSKGKGTTSTLIEHILKAGYHKGQVYLGGNIGRDPFEFLDSLQEDDIVILELSSFQITDLHMSPQVAVLLHVVPEHLDHHKTLEAYREAKAQLLAHQRPNDLAIVNVDYPDMSSFFNYVHGRVLRVTRATAQQEAGWVEVLEGKEVAFFHTERGLDSIDITARKLLGKHNLENILPACLVGLHYGVSPHILQREVESFTGLEHRIQYVGSLGPVQFYDDSIATTPEASIVSMEAMGGKPIHLICGGKGKGAEYKEFAQAVIEKCVSVSFLPGPSSADMEREVRSALKHRPDCACAILPIAPEENTMQTVFSGIIPLLAEGHVVLLAPATASADPYANYKERGEAFVKALREREVA